MPRSSNMSVSGQDSESGVTVNGAWLRKNQPWLSKEQIVCPKNHRSERDSLGHTMCWLDPHYHCRVCRTESGSKCDFRTNFCVTCKNMSKWARGVVFGLEDRNVRKAHHKTAARKKHNKSSRSTHSGGSGVSMPVHGGVHAEGRPSNLSQPGEVDLADSVPLRSQWHESGRVEVNLAAGRPDSIILSSLYEQGDDDVSSSILDSSFDARDRTAVSVAGTTCTTASTRDKLRLVQRQLAELRSTVNLDREPITLGTISQVGLVDEYAREPQLRGQGQRLGTPAESRQVALERVLRPSDLPNPLVTSEPSPRVTGVSLTTGRQEPPHVIELVQSSTVEMYTDGNEPLPHGNSHGSTEYRRLDATSHALVTDLDATNVRRYRKSESRNEALQVCDIVAPLYHHGTAGPRDRGSYGPMGPRYRGTTVPRDHGTTVPRYLLGYRTVQLLMAIRTLVHDRVSISTVGL
jgi:hypothetical protein